MKKLLGIIALVLVFASCQDNSVRHVQKVIHYYAETDIPWVIYYYDEESHKRLKSVFGILGISRKFETYFIQSDRFWDR